MNRCEQDKERRQRAWRDRGLTVRQGDMERRIEFLVGYNHRAFPDDCGGGGHGQHGMEMAFYLIGPEGAVQWKVAFPHLVPGNVDNLGDVPIQHPAIGAAVAIDLGYHWPTPRYEDHEKWGRMDCDILPAGHCYYDGSGLNAGPVLARFLEHGPAAVWADLARYYQSLAGDRP